MSNRLAAETSPYLRQHRDNPVDWWPWGADAMAEAERRDVPILLSVGYSACHWCHVMAHECFEDPDVAAVMNALFVNVKVDREERPDVDALYMEAVQALTGRGGWPMTVFLTPDGSPFFGGTYYPKPQFLQLVQAVDDVWRNRRDELQQNVEALVEAVSRTSQLRPVADVDGEVILADARAQLRTHADRHSGGFGRAPKFPQSPSLEVLLRSVLDERRDDDIEIVTTTLDAMASGGMYDHLDGGFARYSTDDRWLVPHFEKMLYDQASLVRVYLHAHLTLGVDAWKQVVEETIGYVLTTLRHPDGGFFSAEDADSADEHGTMHEGLFYTWTPDEVREVLGPDAEAAIDWFGIDADGHLDGRAIPHRIHARGQLRRPVAIEMSRHHLREARAQRPRPGLDDKVLTEWNAMMTAVLAEAAAAFDRSDWLAAAVANGDFLLERLRRADGRWHRSWQQDGRPPARHDALAADHAQLVDAFTRLSESTGEARWLAHACDVADVLLDHFWDVDHGGLFTTADDAEALVVRQKDLLDGSTPSANGTAALALTRLAALSGERRYAHHADRILQLAAAAARRSPSAVATSLLALDLRERGTTEVVVTGDRPDLVRVVTQAWHPRLVLAWGEPTSSTLWIGREGAQAFVCRDHVCRLPTADPADLARQLAE